MSTRFVSVFSLIAVTLLSAPFALADDKLPRDDETRAEDNRIGDGVDNIVENKRAADRGHERINTRDDVRRGTPLFRESAFYITPQFGGELMSLSEPLLVRPQFGREFAGGYAFGAVTGYRFGLFSVGARYQRTQFPALGLNDMSANKLYAEAGFNYRYGVMLTSLILDVGWASVASRDVYFNGVGAKLGGQLQFYVTRWFSFGPSAHFDVQGYDTRRGAWANAVGATFLASAGFHI